MYENFGNFLLIIFTISKIDFTIKKPILGRKQESMASETTWESMASETTWEVLIFVQESFKGSTPSILCIWRDI